MPYKKPEIKKMFYTIGEVASMFNVNTSCIRHWEKQFDIIKPKRNKKGNRLFRPEDVDNFKLINHLINEKKMTLEGANKKIKENKGDFIDEVKIIEKLKKVKEELLTIKNNLDDIKI